MSEQPRFLKAIDLIYDAAVEAGRWPRALLELSGLLGSSSATLLFGDDRSAAASIVEAVGIDPGDLVRYNAYYVHHDLRLRAALSRPAGAAVTNDSVLAEDAFRRTEFYDDFLRPMDLPYIIGGVLVSEAHAFSSLGIHRDRRRGEYTDEERRLYLAIVPHIQRALAIHGRLSQARVQAAAGSQALDKLAIGVILVAASGEVIFVNQAAQEILDQRDGLRLASDGLHAARSDSTRALRDLVSSAAEGDEGAAAGGGAMTLFRPSLKRPLSVIVAPLRRPAFELPPFVRRAAAIFVTDPDRIAETKPEALRRLYGFTGAESNLVAALVAGKTLSEAAEDLEVSPLTARTQLKAVFQKTGTGRQSQLIRLIMSGLGQLRCR